ncbi:MAG: diacylglycerol kinase family protein, partial [Leucobacter sp.]
ARLRAGGADARLLVGDSPEETRRHAAAAVAEGVDALVVVGGDGTLSLILDEVVGTDVPIALVPAGTGNDLARSLGLPHGSAERAASAADLALRSRTRAIDVAEAECGGLRRRFLTVAALGFDAKVSERTNRLRWPRGGARYYLALVIELIRLRPAPFSLRIDAGSARPATGILVAVANTRSYGGGIPICPEADPADGLLDVTHVRPIGRARLIRLFPMLLRARHAERPEVVQYRGSTIEVSAPGSAAVVDGERIGEGSVRFRVLPGALRVFAP